MVELGHGLGLRLEARAERLVGGELAGQDFDGDGAVERALSRLIDGTHPAAGDEDMNLVGREQAAHLFYIWSLKSGILLGFAHQLWNDCPNSPPGNGCGSGGWVWGFVVGRMFLQRGMIDRPLRKGDRGVIKHVKGDDIDERVGGLIGECANEPERRNTRQSIPIIEM